MNERAQKSGGALQAGLLLAPVFLLAWSGPGWILRGEMVPAATGVGFAALALLPAAAWMLVRGALPSVRGLWLLLVPILIAVAWLAADRMTDTFEASRVLLQWIVALVCVLAGATSSARGRTVLARGSVVATLMLIVVGLFDAQHAFTGALGNTGTLSSAALAGAVAGAAIAIRGRGLVRIGGLAACTVFLVYTARVPVLTGSIAFAGGVAALLVTQPGRARWLASLLLVMSACALAAPFAKPPSDARGAVSSPAASATPASSVVDAKAGGVAVRLLVAKSSLSMSLAHPLAGVGPGQFAAVFPAWRDPREIERTTHGRRIAEYPEVEHPHDDWLAPWLEGGWFAGVAWTAFLLTVAWSAWKRLRGAAIADDARTYGDAHGLGDAHTAGDANRIQHAHLADDVALSAASLALLVNALAHGPLLQNPVSSVLAFSFFGTQLAREAGPTRRLARRFVVIGAFLLLLVVTPRALAFVRHGFALQRLSDTGAELPLVQSAVADAIEACPDSVPAHSWSARLAEARQDGHALVLTEWQRVLDLRPLRIEALIQIGNHLGATQPDLARVAYERVLAIDAHHPGALQNMGTLELNAGRPAAGLAWFDHLPAHLQPSRAWLANLAALLALRGVDDSAEAVFARADPELADRTAEQCFAISKIERKKGTPELVADAWEARAHVKWAREHASAGKFDDAVRSYRQALRLCTAHVEQPRRVLLELGAALMLSGKADEGRAQIAGLAVTPEDLAAMPAWCSERLRVMGEQGKK